VVDMGNNGEISNFFGFDEHIILFILVISAEESLILTEKEVVFPDQPFINQAVKRRKNSVGFVAIACN